MARLSFFASAWLCGVAACVTEGEPRVARRDGAVAPSPQRGRVIGGEAIARIVAWPGDDALARDRVGTLSESDREAIGRSPVPVLVPASADADGEARVMALPHGYAFWQQDGERTVSLQASGTARVIEGLAPAPANAVVRGREAWSTRNEGIVVTSWIEHGAAYALQIECARASDEACTRDEVVLALAESLVFVGPDAGAREEAAR